jgi:hypothetical protein
VSTPLERLLALAREEIARTGDHQSRLAENTARLAEAITWNKATTMKDYRLTGPDEARKIIRDNPACATAPNGTGTRCSCDFNCANYLLRFRGFKDES